MTKENPVIVRNDFHPSHTYKIPFNLVRTLTEEKGFNQSLRSKGLCRADTVACNNPSVIVGSGLQPELCDERFISKNGP